MVQYREGAAAITRLLDAQVALSDARVRRRYVDCFCLCFAIEQPVYDWDHDQSKQSRGHDSKDH